MNRFVVAIGLMIACTSAYGNPTNSGACQNAKPAGKSIFWGDLHVHTAYSLDAWAFGAVSTPADAYRYAKGHPLTLINGDVRTIDRPLDFAAVTDHAETFDQMYLCTDPTYSKDAYCTAMREAYAANQGGRLFNEFLLPIVGSDTPKAPATCQADSNDCEAARMSQWQRVQRAANEANAPCRFTALIGYEWTASPGGKHWHRNVIFRSDNVPADTFDYVRYPTVHSLWQQLKNSCTSRLGCEAMTIPHNINWADGGPTFNAQDDTSAQRALRADYERLAEIYQEKGSSECLPANPGSIDEDCNFNLALINAAKARLSKASNLSAAEQWAETRSTYYRSLLGKGLLLSKDKMENPFMLGAIASTDTHFGTAGGVAEGDHTRGIATLRATDEQQLRATDFNPGGLVAVWAMENTRSEIFDALKRREAYATSGPRIALRFGLADEDYCTSPGSQLRQPMGSTIPLEANPNPGREPLTFVIEAQQDQTKLAKIQIVKGEVRDAEVVETVIPVATYPQGKHAVCVTWTDSAAGKHGAAYWYARVLELPTPRWSKQLCQRANLCDKYPHANIDQAERAWSSPIWRLPQ